MVEDSTRTKKPRFGGTKRSVFGVLAFLFWTFVGFEIAQYIMVGVVWLFAQIGVTFVGVNETILQAILTIIVYAIALLIVIGVPYWIKKYKTPLKDLGLHRLPTWNELGLAPAGFIVYFVVSGLVVYLVSNMFSGFDISQAQDVGFNQLGTSFDYILAFVVLVVVAPIAEETLFRGYLYGKLKKFAPRWVAILAVSALFGFLHGQWNVGIDTFILSIFLCSLRDITGSLWPAIMLHMIKNGIAYYFLFINPNVIQTIQMMQ
jgi:membrane protease YdiL (CAAX protease family)